MTSAGISRVAFFPRIRVRSCQRRPVPGLFRQSISSLSSAPRGISHRYDYPAPASAERAGQEGENEGEKEGAVRKLTASLTVRDNEGRQATESVAINLRPPEEHAPGRAALLSAVAAMLLLGGLGLCLRIAWMSGKGGTAALKGEANA